MTTQAPQEAFFRCHTCGGYISGPIVGRDYRFYHPECVPQPATARGLDYLRDYFARVEELRDIFRGATLS